MFHLQKNLPGWERALRLSLGLIVAAVATYVLPWGLSLALALATAATLAGTAMVGFGPACTLMGRKSLPPKP